MRASYEKGRAWQPALSKHEQFVLYALARFPGKNDKATGREIGFKMSTVTAIRNRLKRLHFFKTFHLPFPEMLGAELLGVSVYRLNPTTPDEARTRVVRGIIGASPEIFWAAGDRQILVTAGFFGNFSRHTECRTRIFDGLQSADMADRDDELKSFISFPGHRAPHGRLFDAVGILGKTFGFNLKCPPAATDDDASRNYLRRIEKKIFLGLMEHPDTGDLRLEKLLGITRQSVTRIRRRLEGSGLIETVRFPDFARVGFELMVLVSYSISGQQDRKNIAKRLQGMPVFFHSDTERTGFAVLIARDYDEASDLSDTLSALLYTKDRAGQRPWIYLMPLRRTVHYRDFDFAPAMREILGANRATGV